MWKLNKRVSHKLGGGFASYLMLFLIILLRKNEILDTFYNGLTDASRDFLDSCAGCVSREQTIAQAEELLNNILKNYDDWTIPESPPKPTPKKRGYYISVLNICKRQRNL